MKTTLPLALALLAACGTVGRDDEPPPRPGNGTGPWTDHGPLQVCLGSAEAVAGPETADDAGWCVAEEARPCTDDRTCRPAERCRCGLCRVVRCSSNAECDADRTCIAALGRCARPCDPAADSCPDPFVCHLGGCVAACSSDDDCAHGEACSARTGRCTAVPCNDDADCDPGRSCDIQTVAAELLHPHFVEDRHGLWVAAELRRNARSEIVRLDRVAPLRLAADPTPLLTPHAAWEADRVGAPALVAHHATTLLLYAGGDDAGIGLAAANTDGTFVRRTDDPILTPTEPWEDGRLGTPAAWPVDDELRLLYVGGHGAGLGLARPDEDLAAWRRVSPEPLVVPENLAVPERWIELDALAEPDVAHDPYHDTTTWFVAARGRVVGGGLTADTAPREWSIGALLVQPDPGLPTVQPRPWGPVVAGRTGVGPDATRDERAPATRRTDDGWEILYVEPLGPDRGSRLRSATCP